MIDTEKGRLELSRFTVDMVVRLALIAGVVYVSFLLLRPILPVLLWAVILAVAVFPLYAPLRRRLHLPAWLAATLLSFLLLGLLLAPVALLSASAISTLDAYAHLLVEGSHLLPPPPESVRDWPLIGPRLHEFWHAAASDTHAFFTTHVGQIASFGRWVGEIAAGVAFEVLQFALAIVVAGVLLGYSERLTVAVANLAGRAADARGRHFVEITGATIRNVSQGVIGVALLQSALLGLGMLVAHVPFAGAITFGCLVLAIVQVGPNVIMIPVIIWVWIAMPALHAALFTVYNVPVLLMDNILRPILMARGLQTPMAIILVGVICGTLAGGLIGLFVGPVVLAVAYDLLKIWMAAGEHPEVR
jgi:predicted PurR-regulated permease PerM